MFNKRRKRARLICPIITLLFGLILGLISFALNYDLHTFLKNILISLIVGFIIGFIVEQIYIVIIKEQEEIEKEKINEEFHLKLQELKKKAEEENDKHEAKRINSAIDNLEKLRKKNKYAELKATIDKKS